MESQVEACNAEKSGIGGILDETVSPTAFRAKTIGSMTVTFGLRVTLIGADASGSTTPCMTDYHTISFRAISLRGNNDTTTKDISL